MRLKNILYTIVVFGLGLFFRFFLITKMPGGLFPDEAAEGLDAQNILHAFTQPFYERGNGREGLFYFLIAPVIRFLGNGYWQIHLVSASIGFLSLIGTFLLAKRLFGKSTAYVSTFLMAVNTWHVVLSRTGFRAILIPFFISFGFYFLVRIFQANEKQDRFWSSVFAGAFLAGGLYSYIAYRIVILIIAVMAILLLITDAKQQFSWLKRYWRSGIVALAAFIIVFLPLGKYFIDHPGSFLGRSGQVSVFNKELNHGDLIGTFKDVFSKSLTAYFRNGDLNWRHNISGLPFLPPLVSPFFGLALAALTLLAFKFIWQTLFSKPDLKHLKYLLLAGLFWGMLLPAVSTAEGIPHGLRSIGTIPAVFIISAVALKYFADKVNMVWHYPWMNKLYTLVVIFFFGTIALTSFLQYFVIAYNSPENFNAFRSDLSAASEYLNKNPDKFHNYLVLDLFSEQTTQFMTNQYDQPYIIVDPASAYRLHLGKDDKIIFTGSTMPDRAKFLANRETKTIYRQINKFGSSDIVVEQPLNNDKSKSLAVNSDGSFWALNLGDSVYWSWLNQSFYPWKIVISQCPDVKCVSPQIIKTNNQNDYLQNSDWIQINGKKSDLFFKAQAFDRNNYLIKDFGVISLPKY